MNELSRIYRTRFGKDIEFRDRMWKVLCKFFQRYVPEDAAVLDVAAGYCEFINNIKAARKIAVDLNPDVKNFASSNVEVVIAESSRMKKIRNASMDIVFVSNFLEHLSKADIKKTLGEIYRVLKKGGRLLVLQPNYRFCYNDYFMFFDHITPLDDRSLSEALKLSGFRIKEVKPRFLPHTTKSRLPKSVFLLKIYLKMPVLHRLIGKQAFIYAEKP